MHTITYTYNHTYLHTRACTHANTHTHIVEIGYIYRERVFSVEGSAFIDIDSADIGINIAW